MIPGFSWRLCVVMTAVICLSGIANGFELPVADGRIRHYGYKIIRVYPHDSAAWTQGLVYDQGFLYESTGRHGQSRICRIDPATGKVMKTRSLNKEFYGEGLTIFQNRLIQLTWRNRIGFVYNLSDFSLIKTFRYPTQGWGLTHDGTCLIMSDGTDILYFLDPVQFQRIRQVRVTHRGKPVQRMNELEYINGAIWANIWTTDRIAIISPDRGQVMGWIHLEGLLTPRERPDANSVLNGIAYDVRQKRLFVTGKLWPKMFEIEPVLLPEKHEFSGNEIHN